MSTSSRTVAYLDGTQMLYRADFGFPSRIRNRRGDDVTGIFGFLALTRKALAKSLVSPSHLLVVFDADAPTQRSLLDPRYRAARPAQTDEIANNVFRHLPWITEALRLMETSVIEHDSAEADDVIASLITRPNSTQDRSIIISRDKDFHQLISPQISQWDSARGADRGWITPSVLAERFGVHPEQWCDYVALVGDRADSMPGVRGIGPVRAAKLLQDGRTLEDATDQLGASALADAIRQRELHRLKNDVVLPQTEPSPLPADGLQRPAEVLEELGLWAGVYP